MKLTNASVASNQRNALSHSHVADQDSRSHIPQQQHHSQANIGLPLGLHLSSQHQHQHQQQQQQQQQQQAHQHSQQQLFVQQHQQHQSLEQNNQHHHQVTSGYVSHQAQISSIHSMQQQQQQQAVTSTKQQQTNTVHHQQQQQARLSTSTSASSSSSSSTSSSAINATTSTTAATSLNCLPTSKKESLPANGKKTKGRVRIKMEYINNKLRRYTTFSKRKTGIMKKAFELATLTGTQVMLLVASETGHVYTFATHKLQPMIVSDAGKALIQTCLNTPDSSDSSLIHSTLSGGVNGQAHDSASMVNVVVGPQSNASSASSTSSANNDANSSCSPSSTSNMSPMSISNNSQQQQQQQQQHQQHQQQRARSQFAGQLQQLNEQQQQQSFACQRVGLSSQQQTSANDDSKQRNNTQLTNLTRDQANNQQQVTNQHHLQNHNNHHSHTHSHQQAQQHQQHQQQRQQLSQQQMIHLNSTDDYRLFNSSAQSSRDDSPTISIGPITQNNATNVSSVPISSPRIFSHCTDLLVSDYQPTSRDSLNESLDELNVLNSTCETDVYSGQMIFQQTIPSTDCFVSGSTDLNSGMNSNMNGIDVDDDLGDLAFANNDRYLNMFFMSDGMTNSLLGTAPCIMTPSNQQQIDGHHNSIIASNVRTNLHQDQLDVQCDNPSVDESPTNKIKKSTKKLIKNSLKETQTSTDCYSCLDKISTIDSPKNDFKSGSLEKVDNYEQCKRRNQLARGKTTPKQIGVFQDTEPQIKTLNSNKRLMPMRKDVQLQSLQSRQQIGGKIERKTIDGKEKLTSIDKATKDEISTINSNFDSLYGSQLRSLSRRLLMNHQHAYNVEKSSTDIFIEELIEDPISIQPKKPFENPSKNASLQDVPFGDFTHHQQQFQRKQNQDQDSIEIQQNFSSQQIMQHCHVDKLDNVASNQQYRIIDCNTDSKSSDKSHNGTIYLRTTNGNRLNFIPIHRQEHQKKYTFSVVDNPIESKNESSSSHTAATTAALQNMIGNCNGLTKSLSQTVLSVNPRIAQVQMANTNQPQSAIIVERNVNCMQGQKVKIPLRINQQLVSSSSTNSQMFASLSSSTSPVSTTSTVSSLHSPTNQRQLIPNSLKMKK